MDHFQHPRNVGKLPDADGVGEVGNAKCGDIMRMYIQVDPETQVITDVKFNTFGCGSAIAPTIRSLWLPWTTALSAPPLLRSSTS